MHAASSSHHEIVRPIQLHDERKPDGFPPRTREYVWELDIAKDFQEAMPPIDRAEPLKQTLPETEQPHAPSMHITDQFRQRDAMMYDLKGDSVRLTLRIEQTAEGWGIEAVTKQSPAIPPLKATGPNRNAALTALAEAWLVDTDVPPVDWASVRAALAAVRAL